MKRKIFAVIGVLVLICGLFAGCGADDELLLMTSLERNIIREEFDEKYDRYDDSLDVNKKASEIRVSGNASSGAIDLKIVENDAAGNAARTFEYRITETLSETISLEKKHSENWTVIVNFNEDSEGHYMVEVYG